MKVREIDLQIQELEQEVQNTLKDQKSKPIGFQHTSDTSDTTENPSKPLSDTKIGFVAIVQENAKLEKKVNQLKQNITKVLKDFLTRNSFQLDIPDLDAVLLEMSELTVR
jgi:hypothetical protein